jgi:NAD(P)-dependent dehydrogenase (short-subunit alcohol dehydrogenase family)
MTDLDLAQKRVVVTGAAGGLGRAFAQAFAGAGAFVLATDSNTTSLNETVDIIEKSGGEAYAVSGDITSTADCLRVMDSAKKSMGGLDILVNNAAMYGSLERTSFEDIEEDVWDKVMAVNVKGVWQMSRAASPLLKETGGGSIINIASATVFSGSPLWMHYVASKGAVISMSRVMAKELGTSNIRVNVLAPGFTLTDASMELMEDAKNYGADRAALKRNAEVKDITGGALYLASPLSSFMTGQTLVIDGGKQFI